MIRAVRTNEHMKKIKILLTSLIAAICLIGCNDDNSEHIIDYDTNNASSLVILCTHKLSDLKTNITFIRDTYTDNVYMKCFEEHGYAGGGSLSPYYNTEGKIMKYDEFTQVHKH